jgi:hypothetical protein
LGRVINSRIGLSKARSRRAMSAASRETECCRAVEAPAFSHGNKRTQQLEFQLRRLIRFNDHSDYKISLL